MTIEAVQLRTWSPLKWAVVVACILALHAGLFLWFARPPAPSPRPPPAALAISMPAVEAGELPGAMNPLLLVRPDAHGFSGHAWLQSPPLTNNPEASNPPPFLLPLQTDRLGTAITQALSNTLSRRFEVAARPELRFDQQDFFPVEGATTPGSTLAIQGGLASRLLAPPVLTPQSADSVLANTVVQIVVDAEGNEFAPPVILETSGSADADASALDVARNLRFKPLSRVPGRPPPDPYTLADGRLVFRWQTVPKPAPAAGDPPANR
jgi:hypothetical protein